MDSLRAIYDLKSAPVTFDILGFLALVDCLRQYEKRERIDLTILMDGFRMTNQRELTTSEGEKRWRIEGILLQCVATCPAVKDLTITDQLPAKNFHFPFEYPTGRTPYNPKGLILPFKHGVKPNECLTAPPFARASVPRSDVTLTIRSARNFSQRNVELADWVAFHKYLHGKGYKVTVIPDQENPDTYSFDWDGDVYVPAAFDMRLRMAVYEMSRMNIGSCHGPFTSLFYTNAPYLMFDHLRGGVLTPRFHEGVYGFPVGGQHAWSNENQIITWEDSSFESLVRRFEEWSESSAQGPRSTRLSPSRSPS